VICSLIARESYDFFCVGSEWDFRRKWGESERGGKEEEEFPIFLDFNIMTENKKQNRELLEIICLFIYIGKNCWNIVDKWNIYSFDCPSNQGI
jgi:hypothetical protein